MLGRRRCPSPSRLGTEAAPERRIGAEIAAAVAALPPELATMVASSISQRPERAAQAIAELGEALRAVELIARNTAAGGSIETTRGPRVIMPAGLGGLVSMVAHTTASAGERTATRLPAVTQARTPAMTWLAQPGGAPHAPTNALGATADAAPAALGHVAWSDRWLARFAGARTQSLDVLSAGSPEGRMQMLAASAPSVFVAPFADEPSERATARSNQVVRFDDNAETPDDVFAAISAGAARTRAPVSARTVPAYDPAREPSRDTFADLVAHSVPGAPGAGLSAQLASSPFAPALRHLLPLGVASTFDVRALFGSDLGATYLSGLLAAPTHEMSSRDIAAFEPTYVAPSDAASDEPGVQQASYAAPLTTLRSALLAFDVESMPNAPVTASRTERSLARSLVESLSLPMLAETASMREPGTVDVGGATAHSASYASPGMIADRAQAWSIAQERSTADLSFDFVTPELILAARVYGLGPAEAAQAARLAIAGPGQLTAMAGAVDRTFVQAMAIESERRGERARVTTVYPVSGDEVGQAPSAPQSTFGVARRAPRGAFLWPAAAIAALGLSAGHARWRAIDVGRCARAPRRASSRRARHVCGAR